MTEWIQHKLIRKKGNALIVRFCWLEADKRINEGSIITLKGERLRWTVAHQFKNIRITSPPRQDWKVGGLW